jgi:hypothetical protein
MGIHVVEYDDTALVPDDFVIADLHAAVFPVAWDNQTHMDGENSFGRASMTGYVRTREGHGVQGA